MIEKEEKSHKKLKIHQRPEFVPLIVFFCICFLLIISSSISGVPPHIEQSTQNNGFHSQTVVINGDNFGHTRASSKIRIGDVTLASSAYIEWSNNRIIIEVPDEVKSGLLYVITKNGKCNGIIYTNPDELPKMVTGTHVSEKPIILAIEPKKGQVGDILKIQGDNFRREQQDSLVYFNWISQDESQVYEQGDFPYRLSANPNDFDYLTWDEREIFVRIPDGASSGNITIFTDKGESNAIYFEITSQAGLKIFENKKRYPANYIVELGNIKAEPENGLYLWVPKISNIPEQKVNMTVTQDVLPILEDYKGVILYQFKELKEGDNYRISLEYVIERNAIKTQVNANNIKKEYDVKSKFYSYYTGTDFLIPKENKRIQEMAKEIIRGEKNPYYKAKKIYEYILKEFAFSVSGSSDLTYVLDSKTGSALDLALLYCALLRNGGVPARPVSGYLVPNENLCFRHFWVEFYINGIGWIPADPVLGNNVQYGNIAQTTFSEIKPEDYYFGNLDNQHITISKGTVLLRKINPKGRVIRKNHLASLQSIHEEVTGNLHSYTINWFGLNVLGIY